MGGKNIFYSFSRWKWWVNSGDYWSWHWPRNQFQSAVLILIAAVDEVKRLIVPIAGQWFSELMGFYWGLKTAVQRALLKFRTSAIDLAQHYGHDRLLGFMVFTSAWAGVYIFYLLGYENDAFSSLGLKYSCLVTMAHTVGNIRHRHDCLLLKEIKSTHTVWRESGFTQVSVSCMVCMLFIMDLFGGYEVRIRHFFLFTLVFLRCWAFELSGPPYI